MLDAALIAARFVHFASLLALTGAALAPLYLATTTGQLATMLHAWLHRLAPWLAGLALASAAAWFELTAATMSGDLLGAVDPAVLGAVLTQTAFGPLWMARLAVLGAILALTVVPGRRTSERPGLAALAAIALMSLAGVGHGLLPQWWAGALHAAADAAHLLAAGVWLGGLWALGALLAAASRTGHWAGDPEVGRALSRFSDVGLAAVVALVASGFVNGWFLLGSPERLVSTAYGRLLAGKIALFLAMLALAAGNRYVITPALRDPAKAADPVWLARIRRSVLAEQLLGVGVVLVVSVLGTLPAPGL